jgi:L-lactate utilization protein LutB
MSDIGIERLVDQYGLLFCVECGKCVAVCPMGEVFDDFAYEVSPRGVIERALLGLEMLEHAGLWLCLTCDLCTDLCPAGVRFRDYVEAARQLAIEAGVTECVSFCRDCGAFLWPRHTEEYLKQALGEIAEELLTLCPRCRQYDLGEKVKALAPGSRRVYTHKVHQIQGAD